MEFLNFLPPQMRDPVLFAIPFFLLLLIVELLNSAIETTVDRISLDEHVLAKRAKDIGSAAVLITIVNLAVTWMLVLSG